MIPLGGAFGRPLCLWRVPRVEVIRRAAVLMVRSIVYLSGGDETPLAALFARWLGPEVTRRLRRLLGSLSQHKGSSPFRRVVRLTAKERRRQAAS